ncbi:MAG: lamin tail domain-containing protein [Candidatus Cloacimonetes bacterium]|nr:lamin tail domain-containing protein [Candidatus Cloacimonadota bacterium]
MKKYLIILSIIFMRLLFADTNFKVMSYNTLNFDGTDRLTYFETILSEVQPDILITQEIKTESAANEILTILNGNYARANFVNDGDLNNMLFYKTSIASLVSQDVINTSPRDISEYQMLIDGNSIRFYSCHLKASEGTTYEAERLVAVTALRNYLNGLPAGTEFIIVGDMNFYTSSEDGYEKFIANETNNIGRAEDLCTEVGSWHNSSYYSNVHTQSTRVESFGGGATGGLDDKFDFIFGNYGINNGSGIEYNTNSFTSYGNDGDHFNLSINAGTNSAVSSSVADALYYASDHLPVCADFVSLSETQTYLIISEYIEGSSYNKAIEIYNGTGSVVDLSAYSLEKDLNGDDSWGNTYNFSGILSNDDVFVLAHSSADQAILDVADVLNNGVINFDGDDQVRLLKYGIEIDRIGISGDIDFAKDVTYVRNSDITNPQSGEQDPRSNGEWTGYPQDTFDYLGSHTIGGNQLPIISNVVRTPAGDVEGSDIVSISADITDADGTLSLVELHWGIASGSLVNTIIMSIGVGDTYTTISDIPAQTVGITVYYEVYTEDNIPESATSDEYNYTVVEAASTTLPYVEPFDADLGICYTKSVSGDTKDWHWNSSGDAKMNGYNSGDTEEDWLILPAIDFDSYTDEVMTFDSWYRFGFEDINNFLKLFYSTDYSGLGDPTSSTWAELSFVQPTTDQVWETSGNIDLSIISGTSVYVAFEYHYEVGSYRWWEIDNISITGIAGGTLNASINVIIEHNGTTVNISWEEVVGANSYYIYGGSNPNVDSTSGTHIGHVETNSWSVTVSSSMKFYQITSSDDLPSVRN